MSISVELRPHVGQQRQVDPNGNVIGTFDINFKQFIVLFNTDERLAQELGPVEFGYVGHHAGEPLNPLPVGGALPPEIQGAILHQVNAQLAKLGYPASRSLSRVEGQWPSEEDEDLEPIGEEEESSE